jgi:uncharacterized repeat protein (TIGR01451 family)
MKRLALLPLALLLLTAAFDPLSIVKTSAVVSDPQGNLLPKRVPGAFVDYTATITNPNGIFTTVNGVTFSDAIPANTSLRVADLGLLSSGPVAFSEGLVPSLLTFSFTSLGSSTDRVDFSNNNGSTWTYTPTADANGCDNAVTNVRVRLGGNQVAGSSFSIRFRVRVK